MNNMNNRIIEVFSGLGKAAPPLASGKKAIIAFVTGGDPDIQTTENLVLSMAEAGADMIEIGIPFSDPVAESIIMQADKRALDGGCTVDKLFEMVTRLRDKTNMPFLFVTYANPIYAYGKDKFMAKCQEVGVDGIVVSDAPFEEREEFASVCECYNICLITTISPSPEERTEKIVSDAKGFLNCIPSLSSTGCDIAELITQVKNACEIPCVVGVSAPEQVRDMAAISDGVVVSSAVVQLVAEFGKDSVVPV